MQPPSKRIKVATSEENINSWWSSWGFRGRVQSALNTFVGGFRRLFHWRRRQQQQGLTTTALEDTTNMDYDYPHPNILVPSQHLSSPIFTSTPSQSLMPMTSVPTVDVPGALGVGTPSARDNLTNSSHISSTSGQPNDQTHLQTHSDEQLHSKQVARKTLKEKELSNQRLSQPEQQVAQKTLKERDYLHVRVAYSDERLSQAEQRVAQKTLKGRDHQEEDWPSREAERLATGQPLRERPRINVDRPSLKEVHPLCGEGTTLRGEQLETYREENLQKSSIPRTSVNHINVGSSMGSSNNAIMSHHSTPASQSTRKPLYSPKQAHI